MHFQWHEILRRGEGKQEPSSMCLMSKQKEEKIISMTVTGKRNIFHPTRTIRKLKQGSAEQSCLQCNSKIQKSSELIFYYKSCSSTGNVDPVKNGIWLS